MAAEHIRLKFGKEAGGGGKRLDMQRADAGVQKEEGTKEDP